MTTFASEQAHHAGKHAHRPLVTCDLCVSQLPPREVLLLKMEYDIAFMDRYLRRMIRDLTRADPPPTPFERERARTASMRAVERTAILVGLLDGDVDDELRKMLGG